MGDVRQRCARYLRALDLPAVCDIHALCEQVSQRRGRPIRLLPVRLPAEAPSGVWVATARADYIVFETDTSGLHQRHIIAHEFSHLLLEHGSDQVLSDTAAGQLLPHLDSSAVQRALCRDIYDAAEEQEAETMASLLLQRFSAWSPIVVHDAPADVVDVLARLSRSLERAPEAGT